MSVNISENGMPSANDILNVWQKQQKVDYFESKLLSTGRNGINNIIEFCRQSDFYTAPSSAKYHSNYDGGLLDHVLLVYVTMTKYRDAILEIDSRHNVTLSDNSVILVSLLHDVCKTGFYKKVLKYRKNSNSEWESYYGYEIEDSFPIGHGEKSVIMLQNFGLEMTAEEMIAIRFHMGSWDGGMLTNDIKASYQTALNKCPLMTVLQMADNTASLLFETTITPNKV